MQRRPFCEGWEFARDDGTFAPVVVPHDAMLGNKRGPDAPAGSASGYFHGARYRYRKRFALSESDAAGSAFIEFEGVYRDARIRVNGHPVEAPPYGFVPFFIDVTGIVVEGENLVEVEADNSAQPDCRWYSGGGLYRPIWLWLGGPAHITPEGVKVTTLSHDPASVRVDVAATGGTPVVRVLDGEGIVVAEGAGATTTLAIPEARPWSAESPELYRCRVELRDGDGSCGGGVLDIAEVAFGIRTVAWGPDGLFVNGRETLLRGGCIHCDNGVIGAATFPESELRRIRLLKDAGFNAVRVAHNPAPSTLLDACDAVGMYVIDESWDTWFTAKSAHDYARRFLDWCDFDLARLISHDYNSPSVIMRSIGNEVADPITEGGIAIERSLVELAHALDPTRPVTCGLNLTMMVMERAGRGWYVNDDGVADAAQGAGAPRGSLLFNLAAQMAGTGMTMISRAPGADALVSPSLDALDIAGYNYASARYALDARKHPDRVIVGSETFPHEIAQNWKLVEDHPQVIGDFMWAAWDYLGEAGAGAWAYTPEEAGFSKPWPWLVAGSGALDALGHPNGAAALAGAVWGKLRQPSIMVRPVNVMGAKTYRATWRGTDAIPSWSWRGCEGEMAEVEVYDARAHEIRLELNGNEVATRRAHGFVTRFKLPYEPGTLRAVALSAEGRELSQAILASAQGSLHLAVRGELRQARAGGIAYVDVAVVGSNGQVESNADERVTCAVEGGVLLGFGSAQPAPTDSYLDGSFPTYRGYAQAIVYRGEPGTAKVTVRGTTLAAATAEVAFEKGDELQAV